MELGVFRCFVGGSVGRNRTVIKCVGLGSGRCFRFDFCPGDGSLRTYLHIHTFKPLRTIIYLPFSNASSVDSTVYSGPVRADSIQTLELGGFEVHTGQQGCNCVARHQINQRAISRVLAERHADLVILT